MVGSYKAVLKKAVYVPKVFLEDKLSSVLEGLRGQSACLEVFEH